MQSLKAIARLYFIHIFAFLAVAISTYYPPWDIIFIGYRERGPFITRF